MEDLAYPIRRQTSTAARWTSSRSAAGDSTTLPKHKPNGPTHQARTDSAAGRRTAPAQQCSTTTQHRARKEGGQDGSPDKGPGGGVPLRSLDGGGGVSQLHGRKSEKRARDLLAPPPPCLDFVVPPARLVLAASLCGGGGGGGILVVSRLGSSQIFYGRRAPLDLSPSPFPLPPHTS